MKVLTAGTFDLFHYGHVRLIERCAVFGEVVVGLNSDSFIERKKGTPPVMHYREREAVLLSQKNVAAVIENNLSTNLQKLILYVQPDILAVGSDWAVKDYYAQTRLTQEWLEEHGVQLIYLPYTDTISSTIIKDRICKQFLSEAAQGAKSGSSNA